MEINKKEEIPKDEKELKKFINDKIKESNFSTNLNDAFNQNNPSYKIVDNNDQRLTDKYLHGKNPNPLYDLKKNKKNFGFASVNTAVIKNSIAKNNSQIKPTMSYNMNNHKNNIILEKEEESQENKPKFG